MISKPHSGRTSRFSRASELSGLVLQERDRQILSACYQYRYLTRAHIQRLFGVNCVTRINARLRKLFDHRFLDRRFPPTRTGSAEALYLLGPNGPAIVADQLGLNAQEVARIRQLNLKIKESMLTHDLAVNDLRISITTEIERDPRCQLVRWSDPRECEQRFELTKGSTRIVTTLKPDGFFQVNYLNRLYSFFVEMDLSTSGHAALDEKFNRYRQFKMLGLSQEAFSVQNFYVLVITKSAGRCEHLKDLVEKNPSDLFWLANADDLRSAPLTANAWWRSGQTGCRSIFKPHHDQEKS